MNISLVVPGLLDRAVIGQPENPALPPLPCLSRLLSRSRVTALPVIEFHELLFYLFGLRCEPGLGVPVAAVTHLADSGSDTGSRDNGFWLRADPVHLRADQSRLVLFDASVLSVTRDEATRLAEVFNEFYSARGWRLEPLYPDRWYLRVREPVRVWTSPLRTVAGHDIDAYLPGGEEAQAWHGVMNEVQMLFHGHPVNQAREDAGKPVINSVWFWGEGSCPQPASVNWTRIVSAEPFSRGFAALSGISCMNQASTAARILVSKSIDGNEMIVLDNLVTSSTYGDAESWRETVVKLESEWFEPVSRALQRGWIDQLTVYPCDGQSFCVTRAGLQRFWRPVKTLETFVAHG